MYSLLIDKWRINIAFIYKYIYVCSYICAYICILIYFIFLLFDQRCSCCRFGAVYPANMYYIHTAVSEHLKINSLTHPIHRLPF